MTEIEFNSIYRRMGKTEAARRRDLAISELGKAVAKAGLPSDGGQLFSFNRMQWISWSMRYGLPAVGVRNETTD